MSKNIPLARLLRPFIEFLKIESASGIVLFACTIASLIVANSPYAHAFAEFWHTPLRIGFGRWELQESLLHWINDGLMTLFFFVIGLEIKREIVAGELRDPRNATLPIFAALGGMVVPAAIYGVLQFGTPGERGWGIPMATDIAFVVGFLALLGNRVPVSLKILLLSLAIVDDLGAVLVIAIFYSTSVSLPILALGLAGLGFAYLLNRAGVRQAVPYVIVGVAICLAFVRAGIHPTVAGVLLAFLAPLDRLEARLHPWVSFGILPVFALANAGVRLEISALSHPVSGAVIAGLALGKPLGILLLSWLAVRIGVARLPALVNWRIMLGAGSLAGIGFTMSLFIAGLALQDELLDAAKIGVLTGSALSAIAGCLLLLKFLPRKENHG